MPQQSNSASRWHVLEPSAIPTEFFDVDSFNTQAERAEIILGRRLVASDVEVATGALVQTEWKMARSPIHKSQGSEYPAVVIPLSTQHYVMLRRNLVYTGITRGRKLVVLVGQRKALRIAVRDSKAEVVACALKKMITADRSLLPSRHF